MELLSDGDVGRLLDFLHQASEVDGPDAFTEPVREAFWQLIPSNGGIASNVFSGVDPAVAPDARSMLSFSEIECDWCVGLHASWTDDLDAVCRQYESQDPIPPVPAFMNRALRVSDVMSRREHHRCELWGDVGRLTGCEDTLRLWFAVPGEQVLRRIQFVSDRWGGLSDRDVHVLELLAPHLVRLHARAAARREVSPALEGLTPREREILGLVARGKTNRETARYLWISPHTVRAHLENIFEKLEVTNRTAAVARAFGTPAHLDPDP